MTRKRLSTRDRAKIVSCAECGVDFDRGYNISAARAARPQLCGNACRSAYFSRARRQDAAQNFWAKVDKRGADDCWEWTGHRRPGGYGWFNLERKPMHASRAAYILTFGEIAAGLFVCHRCDNPPCCNPAHLWLGTPQENAADMVSKGRVRRGAIKRGSEHHAAKLTAQQALEAYNSDEPAAKVAARLGVTRQAILRIRKGLSWAHITGVR